MWLLKRWERVCQLSLKFNCTVVKTPNVFSVKFAKQIIYFKLKVTFWWCDCITRALWSLFKLLRKSISTWTFFFFMFYFCFLPLILQRCVHGKTLLLTPVIFSWEDFYLLFKKLFKTKKTGAWEMAQVIKSSCYSSSGSKLDAKYVLQRAHNCLWLQLWGIQCILASPTVTRAVHIHTHMHTHTHTCDRQTHMHMHTQSNTHRLLGLG